MSPWNDDDSWWHQQDLEMQEQDELERIEACNTALSLLTQDDTHEPV